MWEPRRLTTLRASTVYYRITFSTYELLWLVLDRTCELLDLLYVVWNVKSSVSFPELADVKSFEGLSFYMALL
jgi:hypothetical protein